MVPPFLDLGPAQPSCPVAADRPRPLAAVAEAVKPVVAAMVAVAAVVEPVVVAATTAADVGLAAPVVSGRDWVAEQHW